MSHYYDENQYTKSNRKEISFRFWCFEYTFIVDNGVFSKNKIDTGTQILLESLKKQPLGDSILDMGCGYGVIGIILKKNDPKLDVEMVDINKRAIELAKENAKVNEVDAYIHESNGFEQVNNTYDSIIMNPPIRCGKKVIYGMFKDAFDQLNEKGNLFIVIRKQHGAESAKKYLAQIYKCVEIIDKSKGFWVIKATK